LCGQPELDVKLTEPVLRQLRQRIMIRCRTRPLTPQESQFYIQDRLRKAGSNGLPVFGDEAIKAISRFSGGIPRIVNLLCEHALISAFADQQRPIAAEAVRAVAEEFGLDQAATPLSSLSLPNRGVAEPPLNAAAGRKTARKERAPKQRKKRAPRARRKQKAADGQVPGEPHPGDSAALIDPAQLEPKVSDAAAPSDGLPHEPKMSGAVPPSDPVQPEPKISRENDSAEAKSPQGESASRDLADQEAV